MLQQSWGQSSQGILSSTLVQKKEVTPSGHFVTEAEVPTVQCSDRPGLYEVDDGRVGGLVKRQCTFRETQIAQVCEIHNTASVVHLSIPRTSHLKGRMHSGVDGEEEPRTMCAYK